MMYTASILENKSKEKEEGKNKAKYGKERKKKGQKNPRKTEGRFTKLKTYICANFMT